MFWYLIVYVVVAIVVFALVNQVMFRGTARTGAGTAGHSIHKPLEDPAFIEPTVTGNVAGPVSAPIETPRTRTANVTSNEATEQDINTTEIVFVLLLGAFTAILNQTLINIAIPHMMTDFNVSATTVQWLVTGFMLVNGVLIPVSAFLMETFGTRPLFLSAMSLFTVGSLVCGLAPNFAIMMAGRVVQAMGAGILMPLMMNVFFTIFPPEKRGTAMGIMGIAMAFAPAVGPTVAGWIIENHSWRILFYAMVPIGLLDILLAARWMRNVLRLTYPKFDLLGIVLSTIGFGGILYGFSEAGNNGWDSAEVLISLVVGVSGLILFVWRELSEKKPMLEFRVFKFDVYALTTVINAVITMALFAGMMLLPIYLQSIRGFTPLQAGLLLLPGALIMAAMGPVAGAIFDRIGARWLAVVGLAITAITTWQFTRLTTDMPYSTILTIYIVRSFGMSLLMMPIMTAGMNQLPPRLNSHGTAMSNTIRQVAGSLGTAFLVTVMTNRTTVHQVAFGEMLTADNPVVSQQLSQFGTELAASAGLPPEAGQSIAAQTLFGLVSQQSAINGINDAFVVATILIVVAFILAFFIRRVLPATAK
ncbi:DHA2 family efflux MFS transporter permease subunit [Effusibacillus dendaii]|uniref:MFS transporter n=1 Tax=Effusibacillus dendaii TaxID=2743772 RepID=A0A7I8DCR1_9BACL|nr:DHA2 family efflux MFS transporter permease subunit [Effusibacillus dendaii]BCJ87817.1 MFS transporter [Effusibacillus dendaii]